MFKFGSQQKLAFGTTHDGQSDDLKPSQTDIDTLASLFRQAYTDPMGTIVVTYTDIQCGSHHQIKLS